MTASEGFGRRRFDAGPVGSAIVDLSSSSPSVSSLSESVSSMSSRVLLARPPGRWGRLERGEDAAAACPVARFCVEPKLNLGAVVNC